MTETTDFASAAIARYRRGFTAASSSIRSRPKDTADYLRARFVGAGCTRDVVAADAVTMLHEAAGGTLRGLDRLATSCLCAATRKRRKTVERDIVSRVVTTSSSVEVG